MTENQQIALLENGQEVKGSLLDIPSYAITNPIERAERWIQEYKVVEQLQSQNKQLEEEKKLNAPKVEFHDIYQTADEADLEMEQAAKALGLGLHTFYEFLRWGKVFYRDKKKNLPQEVYVKQGCFITVPYTYPVKNKRDDSTIMKNATKVYITPKGMKRLGKYYKDKFDMFQKETSKSDF